MQQRTVFKFSSSLLLVVALSIQQTAALDLNLKASAHLDATAGIDKDTQDFIAEMLPEVRQEVLKLLQDALPLIDQSVTKYIDRVNDVLDKQINHLRCDIVGVGKTMTADFKSSLPFFGPPAPVTDLDKDKNRTVASFSQSSNPHKYVTTYSDFLDRASNTACQVEGTPDAVAVVGKMQNEIRPRFTAWYRLDGKCDAAKTCYSWLYSSVEDFIKVSDGRDVASSDAKARLSNVKQPADGRFWQSWNPTEYELSLREMLSIHDTLGAAKVARIGLSNAYLDAIDLKSAQIRHDVDEANNHLGECVVNNLRHIEDLGKSSLRDLGQMNSLLDEAVILESSNKNRADALKQFVAQTSRTATDDKDSAGGSLVTISRSDELKKRCHW